MKIGLLFAGQGAQHSGMGKSLYDNYDAAKKVMDLAGDDIKDWCFNGTKELLRQTQVTQPCIYTVTMAAYEAFKGQVEKLPKDMLEKIEIVGMAGFSLGEYSALTAGKVIGGIEEGLKIVRARGQWMSEAGMDENNEPRGGMVAAFGERQNILDCVDKTRDGGILEGVNFNSQAQTVVAGDKEALERFKDYAKKAAKEGAMHIKVLPLSVSTAFHSPMMAPAVPKLTQLLIDNKLSAPETKVFSNVTSKDMMEGFPKEKLADKEAVSQFIAQLMGKQAQSPVYWQETIENMINEGTELFIELGPGNTLSGLVKKINTEALTMNVSDMENLEETLKYLRENI